MKNKYTLMENNLKSPLKLMWDDIASQYKVNKPLNQSGLYVDRGIANDLLKALKEARSLLFSAEANGFSFDDRKINQVIRRAEGK